MENNQSIQFSHFLNSCNVWKKIEIIQHLYCDKSKFWVSAVIFFTSKFHCFVQLVSIIFKMIETNLHILSSKMELLLQDACDTV